VVGLLLAVDVPDGTGQRGRRSAVFSSFKVSRAKRRAGGGLQQLGWHIPSNTWCAALGKNLQLGDKQCSRS
jgi:hypothetical protein